jgi:hypothetical protein
MCSSYIPFICSVLVIVGTTAHEHKLYEFGRHIVRGGKGNPKGLPKKRHLRVQRREARRRLLDGSLVLSREDHFYTIEPRELSSFSYLYSHEESLNNDFLPTLADGAAI